MPELISVPFADKFYELCANAKDSIKLCAPFVKADVVSQICDVKENSCRLSLITKVALHSFHQGASDKDALAKIIANAGNVYNCSNLHSKLYIFDNNTTWITSANLTASALLRNEECGVLTSKDEITNNAVAYFDHLCSRDDVSSVTDDNLSEIGKLLDKIPDLPSLKYPRMTLSKSESPAVKAISSGLRGWKRAVFVALSAFNEDFTSLDARDISQELATSFPNNNNRDAKVRQVLQQLRDLGLVEFTSPGHYKKLWS